MSDTKKMTPATDAAAAAADPTPDEGAAPAAPPEPLGEGGKRALDAERAARKAAEKAAADLAARVQAFEDAQKSDAERVAERLAAAEAAAADARAEAARLRIAAEVGLPADLHEFLVGNDEDTLRAKAQKLAAMATPAVKPAPAPDQAQGAKPGGSGPAQLTRVDLARMTPAQIESARVEGRLADVLAGKV